MTDHKHLWDTTGICRGCGLDANVLVGVATRLLRPLPSPLTFESHGGYVLVSIDRLNALRDAASGR